MGTLFFYHFFREAFFMTREEQLPLNGYHGANERLLVMKQTQKAVECLLVLVWSRGCEVELRYGL